jgi:hypothetical protein
LRWKLAETAWAKMSDVDDDYVSDFLQKLRDASDWSAFREIINDASPRLAAMELPQPAPDTPYARLLLSLPDVDSWLAAGAEKNLSTAKA